MDGGGEPCSERQKRKGIGATFSGERRRKPKDRSCISGLRERKRVKKGGGLKTS